MRILGFKRITFNVKAVSHHESHAWNLNKTTKWFESFLSENINCLATILTWWNRLVHCNLNTSSDLHQDVTTYWFLSIKFSVRLTLLSPHGPLPPPPHPPPPESHMSNTKMMNYSSVWHIQKIPSVDSGLSEKLVSAKMTNVLCL